MSSSKNSASPRSIDSSSKFTIKKKSSCNKAIHKKNSVEDLAEEGYTIGRMFGEGSYSKVKAATFQGKEIAVKIIRRDYISTEFETKFLPRELTILSKVQHPNIVHVYKIFVYPRKIYIFMELIQKGDLLHYIRNRGRLMEFEVHNYFKQMVSAIAYLQSLNIAHRDLKCENIMITDSDEIKIIDFGFSRYTVNNDGRRILSRTFCGSTSYAAPEVLQGLPYNPMMYDIWSLGCILFIMLTGTMPFDDSNLIKMVKCQLGKQYTYPFSLSITKPIKHLISRMLEPDVTKRATIEQIRKCSWLKQKKTDVLWIRRSSMTVDHTQDSQPTNRRSTSTQTKIACAYGKPHLSDECNCSDNSDKSG